MVFLEWNVEMDKKKNFIIFAEHQEIGKAKIFFYFCGKNKK